MDINKKVIVIREEILEEARLEKEKIIEQEKEIWKKKYQKFHHELEQKEKKIIKSYQQEAFSRKEQIISKTGLESKKKLRQKKHDYLQQLRDELLAKLKAYRKSQQYPVFLKKLIKDAVQFLAVEEVLLSFNQVDREIYLSQIADELKSELPEVKIGLNEKNVEFSGGVIVESRNGREMVENSFQTCLDNINDEVARELQMQIQDR